MSTFDLSWLLNQVITPVIFFFYVFRNNVGLSAVCAYNLSAVEEVFSKGKYMQSATVEQSHTKWVRYNGEIPNPRPGAVSVCNFGYDIQE